MTEHCGDGAAGALDLQPLRALRYQMEHVADLGRVLCPPYDMVHAQGRARLLRAHPLNLVRLTLPTAHSPQAAAAALERWVRDGVLAPDHGPAFYVLQVAVGSRVTRGLVATVALDDVPGSALLAHEDVAAAAVAERCALLAATGTDLEPVLLSVAGGIGAVADAVALGGPPLVTAGAGGQSLALWRADPGRWAPEVDAAVLGRRALVADGHHRLAAARRYRARRRDADGPGPWDRVLALVVDPDRHPLLLSAVHRSVDDVPPDRLLQTWHGGVRWQEVSSPAGKLPLPTGAGELVVGDGRRWWRGGPLTQAARCGHGHSGRWHRLDSAVLHEVLLPAAGVDDPLVGYHHDPWTAVRAARDTGGSALLLHPPTRDDVTALAARGELMPRKTTSFGPKPPSGMLLRRHADG